MAGVNHKWYDHELSLQNGLQAAEMEDRAEDGGAYKGCGWATAIRIGW